jgi:hypothetical protein
MVGYSKLEQPNRDCVGYSEKSMILDYLWRYPPYIILLIMIDLVSVPFPPVFLIPVYGTLIAATAAADALLGLRRSAWLASLGSTRVARLAPASWSGR